MTPERWKQVQAVFEQALEKRDAERSAFLQQNCNGDDELRREVESLLSAHAEAGTLFDKPGLFLTDEILNAGAVPAGQQIGAYRIVRELGRGGMGAVYLAERADERYRKRVAIKLIKRGMDTDAVLRHFRREQEILAGLDHPNIARLFDAGTTADGLPYFVMEYVEGVAIATYCDQQRLTIDQRLRLFLQVCAAVSYAHRHTVIHRDLKPSNILVTSDSVPKLLDFGIAKVLQTGDGTEPLMTATGLRPMTPEYASPEQARGEPVTTTSDVYSLGVVLYELLTGRSPYQLTYHAPRDVERAITEQEAKKPSTAIGKNKQSKIENRNSKMLRGDLDNIVLMALRKEPTRRYQTVEQFADDVRRHLEARPVMARRDTIGYRASKFVQRNKIATAAALLILVSLVAGLLATAWEARRATVEKTRAEKRFNDVRQLAHSVLFDYHDAIKDLPGATHARERLVKDALSYLDSLASEAAGDPTLQRELAAAYERVGDVRGGAFSASLGDRKGALDSYFKSLQIRQALASAAPRDLQSRRDLAAIYRKIGNTLFETSEQSRGFDYLQNALALYSVIASEKPRDGEVKRELANTYNDVGIALENRGDMRGALQNHRKAIALREELLGANPQELQARRDLSVSYVNSGRALYFAGDVSGAIEINRKAIDLRVALVAQAPTNADYRRLLAIGHQNDGDYRAQTGDINAALESFEKKISLDQQSIAADPDNIQAQGDYAYSLERIGVLLTQKGDYAAALPYLRNNLATRRKMAARDPDSVVWPYLVVLAHGEIAFAEADVGHTAAALDQCREAIKILNERRIDLGNAYLRGLEAQAYGWIGKSYAQVAASAASTQSGEYCRHAREMFQRSVQIWQDLRARGTLAADDAPKLDEAHRELARCDAALAEKR